MTRYKEIYIAGLLIMAASSAASAQVRLINKPLPPSVTEFAAKLAQVNEVYKTEIASAKTASQKTVLVKTFLVTAGEEKESGAKYAILERARQLSIEAGDFELLEAVSRQMEKSFETSAIAVEIDSLGRVTGNVITREQRFNFQDICAKEIGAAIAQ